jgi:hypothetical protein
MNTQDDNEAHDWVVLHGDADSKSNRQHRTFEFEHQAMEFAENESFQYPSKLFQVGHLEKTATPRQIIIIAQYKAGENTSLKPIIEQCRIILNFERQEETNRTIGKFVEQG